MTSANSSNESTAITMITAIIAGCDPSSACDPTQSANSGAPVQAAVVASAVPAISAMRVPRPD
jgi:hypothetical protein